MWGGFRKLQSSGSISWSDVAKHNSSVHECGIEIKERSGQAQPQIILMADIREFSFAQTGHFHDHRAIEAAGQHRAGNF